MSNHKISTIIITLNEEATIADCLKSVESISDEIIVLDSYSKDNTEAICSQFSGVTFIKTEWLGYSETKNKGAALSQHHTILSIDADERLDEEAVSSITQLKKSGLSGAYSFKRKNFYGGTWIKHGGWYPDIKTRLYQKDSCAWEGDFVHETLQCKPNCSVTDLNGNIEHYTLKDHEHHLQTIHKYAKLAAERDFTNNRPINAMKARASAFTHFIKIYFFKLGFLDGSIGFSIALNSAKSKWLRYVYYKAIKS